MRRILAPLLLAFSLFPTSAQTSSDHRPKAMDSVRALAWEATDATRPFLHIAPTQILLQTRCTATSINEKIGLFLTAAHCISDETLTKVVDRLYFIGDPLKPDSFDVAMVLDADLKHDLAILRSTNQHPVPDLRLQPHDVAWGQPIRVIGYSFAWNYLTLFQGFVASPTLVLPEFPGRAYMLYQLTAAPGNSGSAIVNSRDEIVSVLQLSWGPSFEPVTAGVDWATLRTFAEKYFRG